ncbi:tyrosine--tRNA ligase [Actinomarinicola tropica]|uniref:tyrosine--tRNA ligase n=1 Tax=Actinomarinicola tropica TaxID=2789776 RepID=UPI001E61DAD8|nr:tyrosine--tRNA ligase [Actinomarinicola tropica]
MSETGAAILDDLAARGLIHDSTDLKELRSRLAEGPITVYYGCDPTADSLHVGHLIGLLVMRRFQDAGHRPIVLAGGATGMIGDPGGRSEERNLLDDATLARNLEGIVPQLRQFLDFEDGATGARLVDNRSWTVSMTAIDFLRDVGKLVTVNQMLAKEAVRSRIEGEHGISYTEFSYMLLQANDFVQLAELEGCEMQVGGSDQWGNIALGVDLVRRRLGRQAHAVTWPLLTRADGTKYGKSASGEQMWLGAHRTSPYRLYQGWMQADDADVRRLLLQLTLLPVAEAEAVADEHEAAPERRIGQRRLAAELVTLIHGPDAAEAAAAASDVLFGGGSIAEASLATLETLAEEVPSTPVARQRVADGPSVVDLAAEVGLTSSKSEARKLAAQGGLSLNGVAVDESRTVGVDDLLHGRIAVLRKGKRHYHLVVAGG